MFPLVELFVKAWNYLFHEYSESSFLKLFSFYAFVCAIMYINLLGASTERSHPLQGHAKET